MVDSKMMTILVLLISFTFSISQTKKNRIAVLDLAAVGVSKVESITFADRLRSELVKIGAFFIVERSEMNDILAEQGFQMTGCTSEECAVEAGKLLNVNQICAGSIVKVGNLFTVAVRIIDVETGTVLRSANEDCQCPFERVLTHSIKNVATKLISKKFASLTIYSKPTKAEVYLNGEKQGITPISIKGINPGEKLNLKIKMKLYDIWKKSFNLNDGQNERIDIELKRKKGKLKFTSYPQGTEIEYLGKKALLTSKEIELPTHFYTFPLSAPGYLDKEYSVLVEKNKTILINVKLDQKTTVSALTRSIFVPGWGQAYQGKTTRSWIYGITFFGSVAGAIYFANDYNQSVDADKSKSLRNTFILAAGAIWLWNIVDVMELPPAWKKNISISASTNDGHILAGLRIKL